MITGFFSFFGYLFYLFTPYLAGSTRFFEGYPGMDLYQRFFNLIPQSKLQIYLLVTISWLPAFFLGHWCFSLLKPYKQELKLFQATTVSKSLWVVGGILLLVLLLFIYLGRESLFGGYRTYDEGARGKFSTLLSLLNFLMVYQLITKARVSNLILAGVGITAFLLLTMGGRMYVFQTVIIVLIYKTSFAEKRWSWYKIIVFALLGLFIGSLSGVWRMGSSFSLDKAAYSFFAEPVFTWFSTSSFLSSNEIPVVNVPENFLTSFINLVPNTVISLKPYVVSTQQMGYITQSPLGADSVWSNFVINFGSVGSFFFVFITGFILNFLRHLSERNHFMAAYYILVCAVLPFQFFRDGFYIMNKQLFFNFLLLPGLILFVMSVLVSIRLPSKSPELA